MTGLIILSVLMFVGPSLQCDLFAKNQTCKLEYPHIIVDVPAREANLSHELDCQNYCQEWNTQGHDELCSNFTWLEKNVSNYHCILLNACWYPYYSHCDFPLCVTGPVSPDLESCCDDISHHMCLDTDNHVETIANSPTADHCQEACRQTWGCEYFSWQTEICLLFTKCNETAYCDSCISGPFTPPISTCDIGGSTTTSPLTTMTGPTWPTNGTTSWNTTHTTPYWNTTTPVTKTTMPTTLTTTAMPTTLTTAYQNTTKDTTTMSTTVPTTTTATDKVTVVIGGIGYGLLETVEVITPTQVCNAGIENVPSTKYGASAVYLPGDNSIVMCGGYDNYVNLAECHKLSLTTKTWSQFPSMSQARYRPTLTYVPDLHIIVAIAGNNEAQAASNTVEIFYLDQNKWVSIPELSIPKVMNGQCAFYKSPHIYIVGGRNGGLEQPDTYRLDLTNENSQWELMASMFEGKAAFGCVHDPASDTFYVAGGGIDESAFAYDISADKWERLANLNQMRDGPGLGMIGGVLTTFGGRYSGEVDTFEKYEGTRWIVDDKYFIDVRDSFAYIDVPEDAIKC